MNSCYIIQPYKIGNTWVYDDPDYAVVQEELNKDINSLIERILREKKMDVNKFTLFFSEWEFPGADYIFSLWEENERGSNYWCKPLDVKFWLGPSLLDYFDTAPKTIYIKIYDKMS